MPGKKTTIQQVKIYMNAREQKFTQKTSAAKAGFSERTGRRIEKDGPPIKQKRHWRTRKDPFENVWESDVEPLLKEYSNIQGKTILRDLQRKYRGEYPDNLVRTLQRRVNDWRATKGPNKEVVFLQIHEPGFQSLSDFTSGDKLGITIQRNPFDHLIYHFRAAFSGWEYAKVILGGESFTALSEGLQNAFTKLGGVTETHRTDSLSAAYKNLSGVTEEDFTERYDEVCRHYNVKPTRNNKGVSHENGTIEVSHFHLKSIIAQELMLRGSKNFETLESYRAFVQEIIDLHNERLGSKFKKEKRYLKKLPNFRTCDYDDIAANVSTSSIIKVKQVSYSVPSRLIGHKVKVHLHDDRLEVYYKGTYIQTCERLRFHGGKKRPRNINYRHVIHTLIRKPQAFRRYKYQSEIFPNDNFRWAWQEIDNQLEDRQACREFVMILKEAADGDESKVSQYLEKCRYADVAPRLKQVQELFRVATETFPEQQVEHGDLEAYDRLVLNTKSHFAFDPAFGR